MCSVSDIPDADRIHTVGTIESLVRKSPWYEQNTPKREPTPYISLFPLPSPGQSPPSTYTTNNKPPSRPEGAASSLTRLVNLPGSRLHLVPRLNKSEKRHFCAVPCLRRLNGVSAWAFFRWLLALRMGGCMHCPAALGLGGSLTGRDSARVRARRCG